MTSTLTGPETWSLLTLSAACVGIIVNTFQGDGEPLIASLAFSGIAFAFTFSLIRWLGDIFIKAGLKGRDMSKLKKVEMYEFPIDTPFARLMLWTQPRDHGSYLRCCVSSYDHCVHTISILQGHRGSYIRGRQSRICCRTSACGNWPHLTSIPA